MKMRRRVLVVDDEESIRALAERALGQKGMKVLLAATAEEGLRLLRTEKPDVAVLDINLPDGSGEALCQEIRKNPQTRGIPVLMFTGQSREGLPAQCLDGGADDYLRKPFDIPEFIARIQALLRRPSLFVNDETVLVAGPLEIHTAERRVLMHGQPVADFSPKEYGLLYELALHAPKVLDKETLARKVWGSTLTELNTRTLDVHIRRIRQKLGKTGGDSLKTVPVIGYQWIHPVKPS